MMNILNTIGRLDAMNVANELMRKATRATCLSSTAAVRATLACLVLSFGIVFAGGSLSVAQAQEDDQEEQDTRRVSQQLDAASAKVLLEVYELTQADQFQAALGKLNEFVNARGANLKAYDKSSTYELRAIVKVNLEDYAGALRDFQTALDANGFPVERNNQLRYSIAQLHFQLENYDAAIRGLEEWLRLAQTPDPNAYYLLAAAYYQKSNFRAALPNAERVVAIRPEPKKGDHDLLNIIYSELNENAKRANLLEKMINLWPNERGYWTQLSGLYSTTGRDQDAFSVLEVAYRAGLLSRENELLTLVQYYSFFDNPFRGARLMEREMEAGNIARSQKNFTLLSQLWSQAREHKRAIPVLRTAAQSAPNGELFYRLGQVLLADEQYAESEKALVSAINKGGMTARQTGDAWMLLGTARFSQAGPDNRAQRTKAREAFVNAQRYPEASRQASSWVTYIDAIADTERRQDELERAQEAELARAAEERRKQAEQVCRLRGEQCDVAQAPPAATTPPPAPEGTTEADEAAAESDAEAPATPE